MGNYTHSKRRAVTGPLRNLFVRKAHLVHRLRGDANVTLSPCDNTVIDLEVLKHIKVIQGSKCRLFGKLGSVKKPCFTG